VAQSLHNLANLYRHLGENGKVEPLYQRSLAIWEAKLGKEHPEVALGLHNLGVFQGEQGRWEDAVGSIDQERRSIRRDNP
jgi:hypothetical protein